MINNPTNPLNENPFGPRGVNANQPSTRIE
jgi:hypothetical protein